MENQQRKISALLIIGIVIAPIIFVWFTLRKGYSKKVRILSFGYLALGFILFAALPPVPSSKHTESKPSTEQTTDQKKSESAASEPTTPTKPPEPVVEKKQSPVASEIQTHEAKVELKDQDHKSIVAEKPKLGQTGLKITPDQFFKNYNKEAKGLDDWQITKVKYMEDGKTINFNINRDFFIIGQIDKDKNLDKLIVGLTLSAKNRSKIQDQDLELLEMGQTALAALDNNNEDLKVSAHREATLNVLHGDLLQDEESLKGSNIKTATYENILISVATMLEVPALTIRFEPRP